ncbi:malonyl-ACP O-methyltransferase BioC [Nitrosomonas eutropha]|uniref:Malonyl-[acyl-carrier protein] O-methyltransferase n=2 Tax=Nitrosomonas eutropha TaxID=916 RepID=A0ABX5M9E4_9PROT|nr:malonyl-ACP O-methyltransferase BioC [Nitrosomonas eutropha]ABI60357.1 biotin biosynthesis protein BioC [Nitrosomonas eutropha C91]PXV83761.1 malonyl-CoA O-methyltransferase [Nitrosomonas eutropha]SEI54575.1 malonyl-CoA O-methyltransferase [Nitrosomonas eutropha]
MLYDHVLDKRMLRRSFEQAATSYDQSAVLQREICDRMLSRLEYIKYVPGKIIDAGSGTGYGTRKLIERYPAAEIMSMDIALTMHDRARAAMLEKIPGWQRWLPFKHHQPRGYICADIEQLPLREASVGMIWSNLAFQWCNDLRQTFAEAHRVLEDGGLLMFSTFGPDTLKELRQAFKSVDPFSHVNRFTDMHDVGDMLVGCGFSLPVMDMEYITLTYDDVKSAMQDLKAIGARNVTQGRRRGLMGKTTWQQVINQYETLRKDGRLPATYEVVYGHAWKPEIRKVQLKPETRRKLGLDP